MASLPDVNVIRCVIIGDRTSRRRMMLRKYANYTGASYDSENGQVVTAFNDQKCIFVDSMLNTCIENAHVFLICVSVACQANVEETVNVILNAVIDRSKNVPFVLVGTQIEKRLQKTIDITSAQGTETYKPMPLHCAESFAKRIGAIKYLECSEITGEGLEEVFEGAFEIGYHYALEQQKHSQRKKTSSKNITKRIPKCIMQ